MDAHNATYHTLFCRFFQLFVLLLSLVLFYAFPSFYREHSFIKVSRPYRAPVYLPHLLPILSYNFH